MTATPSLSTSTPHPSTPRSEHTYQVHCYTLSSHARIRPLHCLTAANSSALAGSTASRPRGDDAGTCLTGHLGHNSDLCIGSEWLSCKLTRNMLESRLLTRTSSRTSPSRMASHRIRMSRQALNLGKHHHQSIRVHGEAVRATGRQPTAKPSL
jgi:hypothetical protein